MCVFFNLNFIIFVYFVCFVLRLGFFIKMILCFTIVVVTVLSVLFEVLFVDCLSMFSCHTKCFMSISFERNNFVLFLSHRSTLVK